MKTLMQTKCPQCGGFHAQNKINSSYDLSDNHFFEDFPQNPVDLVNDYLKMGLYNQQTVSLAKKLTEIQLKETLISNPNLHSPSETKLIEELIQETGGIETALSVAFGDRSSELFQNPDKWMPWNYEKSISSSDD